MSSVRLVVLILAASCATHTLAAAEVRKLTLPEAVQLALQQNRALKIARLRVAENEAKQAVARSKYFPIVQNQSTVFHSTAEQNIEIPAGAFGRLPNAGLLPNSDVLINQGGRTFVVSGSSVTQPLTQLLRIHQANRIAQADTATSRLDAKKAENEIALQVHGLYYGILIARLQRHAAEQQSISAQQTLVESEEAIRNGSALKVAAIQGRASLLESRQSVLTLDLQISDLNTEFNDLLGLPLDTSLELSDAAPPAVDVPAVEEYERSAFNSNPELLAAAETVRKTRAGVTSAKTEYIPDIALYARHSYQNGVPFLVHNFGTFGMSFTYDVFDFGRRRAEVREREAQAMQAEENLRRLKEEVQVRIERSYNKVKRTREMIGVASEAVKLRQESERVSRNQLMQHVVLRSNVEDASAALSKAQADLLQAQLAYLLARAELEEASGRTPGI